MGKLSCDIKYMYRACAGHKFILLVADEVTHFLVTIPLYRGTSYEIGEALINYIFCKPGLPKCSICEEDKAFSPSIMHCICKRLGIKIKTTSSHSHDSLCLCRFLILLLYLILNINFYNL